MKQLKLTGKVCLVASGAVALIAAIVIAFILVTKEDDKDKGSTTTSSYSKESAKKEGTTPDQTKTVVASSTSEGNTVPSTKKDLEPNTNPMGETEPVPSAKATNSTTTQRRNESKTNSATTTMKPITGNTSAVDTFVNKRASIVFDNNSLLNCGSLIAGNSKVDTSKILPSNIPAKIKNLSIFQTRLNWFRSLAAQSSISIEIKYLSEYNSCIMSATDEKIGDNYVINIDFNEEHVTYITEKMYRKEYDRTSLSCKQMEIEYKSDSVSIGDSFHVSQGAVLMVYTDKDIPLNYINNNPNAVNYTSDSVTIRFEANSQKLEKSKAEISVDQYYLSLYLLHKEFGKDKEGFLIWEDYLNNNSLLENFFGKSNYNSLLKKSGLIQHH